MPREEIRAAATNNRRRRHRRTLVERQQLHVETVHNNNIRLNRIIRLSKINTVVRQHDVIAERI